MDMFVVYLLLSMSINFVFLFIFWIFIKKKGGIRFIKLLIENRIKKSNTASVVHASKQLEFSFYRHTTDDIVFLGDSIKEAGRWFEYFPNKSCRNRGIGGDTTNNILKRIDSIIVGKPSKIFLLIGINDLLSKLTIEDFRTNYRNILKEMKNSAPETKLYVESILPINTQMCKDVLSRKTNFLVTLTNEEIKKTNEQIEKMCKEMGITFIDTFSGMLDEQQQLDEKYSVDGVHLSPEGYLSLSDKLATYVHEDIRIPSMS